MITLDSELLDFVRSPVLLMVCAADSERRPAIGRAMGVRVDSAGGLDVLLSRWQWPEVVRNIGLSGRLALTASRASDYVTYQLKGAARVREAERADIEAARAYWRAVAEALARDHVPPHIAGQWSPDREMVAARLNVAEVYVQTPGPLAGTSL